MSYISKSKIIEFMGEFYWVNAKGSGLYTQPLKKMLGQIEAMMSYHNKVFLLRFDLHQPIQKNTSKDVTVFFKKLTGKISSEYKLKRIGYAWAREQENVPNQHYHCFILIDGNKVQAPHKIIEIAQWYWEICHDGRLVWPSERCYHQIKKGDTEALQNAIYHISYLAKGRGKEHKPSQSKNFGISRLAHSGR